MAGIKKWSDDKLSFNEVTNNGLVCKDCAHKCDECPVGKCAKYNVKPNRVLLGGKCDEYEKDR